MTSLELTPESFRERAKKIDFTKDIPGITAELSVIHTEFSEWCHKNGAAVYVSSERELAEKFVEDKGGDVDDVLENFIKKNQAAGFTGVDKLKGKIFANKSDPFGEHGMRHEVMHYLSAEDGATPVTKLANNANEGITEYLTRLVAPVPGVEDRFYQQPAQFMQALCEKKEVGFQEICKAFFSVTDNCDNFLAQYKKSELIAPAFSEMGTGPRFEKVTNKSDYNGTADQVNKKNKLGLKFA